jgi:hypothetical protein
MEETQVNRKRQWVRYLIWSMAFLLVVGVGTFGFYKHYSAKESEVEGSIVTSSGKKIDETIEESMKSDNPEKVDVSKIDYDYWKEYRVIATMHEMTHQKVVADEKWGATQITEERVNMLYNIVKHSTYKEKLTLLKILSKWKAGDFHTVDSDHNTLWKIQDGTIGEATGILSEEEEQNFIEKTFKNEKEEVENK